MTKEERRAYKIAERAFEEMAYNLVSEFSGCEPHPQLEEEMLMEYRRIVKLFRKEIKK